VRTVRGWFEHLDLEALKVAARAAVVMPACFAISNELIGNPQMGLFAAFGSFAILALVEFGGRARSRLIAYGSLTGAGLVLIVLGTLCSQHAWLAATAMGLIGFAVLFSGVISGYFAAAAPAVLLSFVLAVMVEAPASAIPSRLAGWLLAAVASVVALMLLWPARPQRGLRAGIASACRALADQVEAVPGADAERDTELAQGAIEAVRSVTSTYLATPYRPTGPTGPPAAIGQLVEDLAWLRPFASGAAASPDQRRPGSAAGEIYGVVVQVLRGSASAIEGGDERPDLDRLDRARESATAELDQRVRELDAAGEASGVATTLEEGYQLGSLSDAAVVLGVHALGAAAEPEAALRKLEEDRPERAELMPSTRIGRTGELARGYASDRSVWFRNSIRGAVGLGLAVLIAQLLRLDHSFWVVLGTLSVLRSNALGTGSTVLQAIAGTLAGIIIGGVLVYAIGADTTLLWVALPISIVIGAYAPRAVSFAAGQAGFTVVVIVLFNLVEPEGWEVGLARIEDVAIACAISLAVGLLFWPRGAAGVVRRAMAGAYDGATEYLTATVEMLLRGGDRYAVERIDQAALASLHRLDDAFRQYLAERSPGHHEYHDLATLLAGATRIRRTGHALRASSAAAQTGPSALEPSGEGDSERELERDVDGLARWYRKLGQAIVSGGEPPAPELERGAGREHFTALADEASRAADQAEMARRLGIAWTSRHLETLRGFESHLAAAARELADSGRQADGSSVAR